jgi:hypothetical protein
MTLCEICKSIPFRNLPQLPDAYSSVHYYAWKYPFLITREPVSFSYEFSYWSKLEALRKATTGCELCKLILPSVEKVETAWNEVTEGHHFKVDQYVARNRQTFEMQLWKRIVPSDGFIVVSKCEHPSKLQVVAAVGLSVEEGKLMNITGTIY